MTKVLFITTLPFLMTDLAKLQKHVALIVVCYKLEVLHRGLRHSPIEVEAVCIELQSERYIDNAQAHIILKSIKSWNTSNQVSPQTYLLVPSRRFVVHHQQVVQPPLRLYSVKKDQPH